jgi:hypothetical protein
MGPQQTSRFTFSMDLLTARWDTYAITVVGAAKASKGLPESCSLGERLGEDMTRAYTASPKLFRDLATAPLFGAVIVFGSATHPAIANADPSWDLELMDECFSSGPTDPSNDETWIHYHECCIISGGVWQAGSGVTGKCVAPPGQGSSQNEQMPSGVADNPQVAPPPEAAPPKDLSRIPHDNIAINPGPSAPATTPVPSP